MFSSQILDVAIGLAMMYLFQSILISGINDLLVALLSVRGKVLKKFLVHALKTSDAKDTLFNKLSKSPFINNLQKKGVFPSEISSRNFSDAIIEVIVREDNSADSLIAKIKKNIDSLPEGKFKSIIITRLQESGDDYEKFKLSIEEWFNDYMSRLSSWYKKRVTYFMYLFAFVTTIALNVDSFFVMNELWRNDKLRESVVAMSEEVTRKEYSQLLADTSKTKDSTGMALTKIKDNYQNLHMLDFPITWAYAYQLENPDKSGMAGLSLWEKLKWTCRQLTLEKILGFMITTLAVSIGAPIWYDLLKKIIGVRELIKKKPSE